MPERTFPTLLDLNGHFGEQPGTMIDLSDKKDRLSRFWCDELRMFRLFSGLEDTYGTARSEGMDPDLVGRIRELTKSMSELPALRDCSHCGARVSLRCDEDAIRIVEPCAEAGGIKPYDVHLHIPSGKIVFANDLRALVTVRDADVNTSAGQRQQTRNAAAVGMVMVFVGNSCPSVYRTEHGLEVSGDGRGERLGTICTDLWWYCAMDHALFLERCATEDVDPDDAADFIVDVLPGVYAFSDELPDRDGPSPVYSLIRKVDAPVPVLVVEGPDTAATLADSRFLAFAKRHGRGLPDPYTTLGNGLFWINGCLRTASGHPKQTPFASISGRDGGNLVAGIPELPGFDPRDIYPVSWDYPGVIGTMPADVNLYFLAAGLMILEAAVTRGVKFHREREKFTQAQADAANEEVRLVLAGCYDMACELATSRGLFADGSLERAFVEITEWLSGEAAGERRGRFDDL